MLGQHHLGLLQPSLSEQAGGQPPSDLRGDSIVGRTQNVLDGPTHPRFTRFQIARQVEQLGLPRVSVRLSQAITRIAAVLGYLSRHPQSLVELPSLGWYVDTHSHSDPGG